MNKSTLISFSSVFYTKVTLALLLFSGWQTNTNLLLYRQNLNQDEIIKELRHLNNGSTIPISALLHD